jgi:hypothetical protein
MGLVLLVVAVGGKLLLDAVLQGYRDLPSDGLLLALARHDPRCWLDLPFGKSRGNSRNVPNSAIQADRPLGPLSGDHRASTNDRNKGAKPSSA